MVSERISAIKASFREVMDWLEYEPDPSLQPAFYTYGQPNKYDFVTLAAEYYEPNADIDWRGNPATSGNDREMMIRTADQKWVYVAGCEVLVQDDNAESDTRGLQSFTLEHPDDLPIAPKGKDWQLTPDITVGPLKVLAVNRGEIRRDKLGDFKRAPGHRAVSPFEAMRQNAAWHKQAQEEQLAPIAQPEPASQPDEPVTALSEEAPAEAEQPRAEFDSEPATPIAITWSQVLDKVIGTSAQLVEYVKSGLRNYYGNETNGRTHKLTALALGFVALSAFYAKDSQSR